MYIKKALLYCLKLELQTDMRACSRARAKTGKRIAARMAIMAITTSSSIRVNAGFRVRTIFLSFRRLSVAGETRDHQRRRRMTRVDYACEPASPAAGAIESFDGRSG